LANDENNSYALFYNEYILLEIGMFLPTKFGTFLLTILVILSSGTTTLATDHFVSNLGDFNTAVLSAQPGDTITMANGEWTDVQLVFQTMGTMTDSILLRADSSGYVVLNGTSTLRIAGDYLIVNGLYFLDGSSNSGAVVEFRNGSTWANHSRLTNTAIVNYNPSSWSIDYKWISLYGANNRVDHCYVRGKNHSGTTLVVWLAAQPNYHRIDHNYFDYRPELGVNGGETIRVGTSDWSMYDSYTVVEYNYFEHCNGEIEIISSKSCENIYRYNTFFECEGALTLRHGNRCTVQGNFFLGNNKSSTGGVRVIGEDHKVFNNYFQDLRGTTNRAALSIMNGVPNSPLNRYFQVKRAEITFNTFMNCNNTIIIGRGSDSELTLPPLNCKISNNAAFTQSQIIIQEHDPINMTWEGDIFFGGPLGIPQPPGITITDPILIFSSDSLWRPDPITSPLIGNAAGNYSYVADDMDGHSRGTLKDIGADQYSTVPVLRRPLAPEDVGPDWFPLPEIPPTVIAVEAGHDSLQKALLSASDGDIIELVTDGGLYPNSSNLAIDKKVVIRASDSLVERPVIRQTSSSTSTRILFEIKDGGSLSLNGIELDGMAGTATPAKYLIRTDDNSMSEPYVLNVNDCYLHDVVLGSDGNFFRAYPGTFADTISFQNCVFKTAGKEGIRLKDESSGSGLYNVGYFELVNCTFWDIKKEAVWIYAGDDVPFTPGPEILINHCTFDSCGFENSHIIHAEDVDFAEIKNCLFSYSSNTDFSIQLYGFASKISFSDTFQVGPVLVNGNAQVGSGMVDLNPGYRDRFNGDFTLLQNSPVWFLADDGKALGDLRWAANPPLAINMPENNLLIESFVLEQNYPNPFNPNTTIRYGLSKNSYVTLQIFDLRGALIETLVDKYQMRGSYELTWKATEFASGVYLYRINVDKQTKARKMFLLK